MYIAFSTEDFTEGHRSIPTFSNWITELIADKIEISLHEGLKPKEIAKKLCLEKKTVYNIIANKKIGIKKYCK